ncbi:TlpA family protein disulfide reductase [Flavobacterium rhizosphaerae]|uniref:Redoxin domain-containing protein n=1 Tax=Flavobacterium rhizosphaerae TaxID=3163298 RepID=A0ABW8YVL9_9FLAO
MKALVVYIAFILCPLLLYSQGDSLIFSNAIRINFNKYKKDAAYACRHHDAGRTAFLFDSLVKYRLAGTTFDNFTIKKCSGGKLKFNTIDKPVVLITYASWCVRGTGEIDALNRLAQKYGKEVQFVVLFWDRKKNMKKIARKFSGRITVCYAHEYYGADAPLVSSLKHTLGLPLAVYLDKNRTVKDIRRCGTLPRFKATEKEKAMAVNYNSFLDGMALLLLDREIKKEMLAVK